MLENGYIKLYRQLLNWEWYKNPNTFKTFIHLLLTVNYEDKRYEGLIIKRGSRVASINTLACETGLSVQSVRTAINHLKSTKEITSKQQGKCTVFTVSNYDAYQDNQQDNQQTSNKVLTNEQQGANSNERKIKKDNKANNINKYIYIATEKFKSAELTQAVIDFSDYRQKIKKPMTRRAVELLINKLIKLSQNDIDKQIAILNQSIEHGWQTVYPLREDDKNNAGNIRTDNSAEKLIGNVI